MKAAKLTLGIVTVPVQDKRKVESSDTQQIKKQKRQHNNSDYATAPQAPASTASRGSAAIKHSENSSVHLLGSIRGSEESTIALQTVQEGVDRSEELHSDSSVGSVDHSSGAVGSGSEYRPGGDAERSQGQGVFYLLPSRSLSSLADCCSSASTSQDVEIVSQAQPTQPDEQLDLQSDPFLRVVLRCISVIRYSTHNLFQMQDAEEGAKRHLARLTLSSIHALRRSALTLVESRGAELARAEAIGYERGLREAERRYSKEK